MDSEFFVCGCYFTNNIFLQAHKLHVTFNTKSQFLQDYREVLKSKGCESEDQLEEVLKDVMSEVERRKTGGKEQVERCRLIRESYIRLIPSVYRLSERYLEPDFLKAVAYAKSDHAIPEGLIDLMSEEDASNVFSLPVFTPDFCAELMKELENFGKSDLPKGRPNTMNRGGILLSELGFDENFINPLREHYLMPLAHLLYPEWVGRGLDSHRAFIVKYAMEDDVELSYHFDNAEVTLNVCLGQDFSGGDLYFGAMKTERSVAVHRKTSTYQHRVGRGLLHRAQHMHGAYPITDGERYNLIIWMRSSSLRNKFCPMCNQPPRLVANLGYGDGFTA